MTLNARLSASLVLASLAAAQPALGQVSGNSPVEFHLAPQTLENALLAVARSSGRQIVFASDLVAGKQAPRLSGRYTVVAAVRRLLQGSGLTVRDDGGALVVVAAADAQVEPDVIVTGTRIRGGVATSTVTTLTQAAIRNAGQTDLGEAARSLPQSFGGGQNPGVGVGASGFSNVNLNATSSINLRGLGPDATLTLLNGHRLAYDGASQAIDISAIPLAAVDRLEIVPDGASALYGSDAVGGVANIILRRDFNGAETSARVAVTRGGGDAQQEGYLLLGRTWSTGGVLATYDYSHDSAVEARQRAVASAVAPSTYLLWPTSHHNAVVSGHQLLAADLEFTVDGFFSSRLADGRNPYTATGTVLDYGSTNHTLATSFAVAPKVAWTVGPWTASLSGVYGEDNTQFDTIAYNAGRVLAQYDGCQCNGLAVGEFAAEGPVIALPGGDARLAIGAGYRANRFHSFQRGIFDVTAHRGTEYGYGELSLPFVGGSNQRPFVHALAATIAGRLEHYAGATSEVTPKLGLVYEPAAWLAFKGSWGRSFKAPTLYQQHSSSEVDVFRTVDLGYTNYPAGSSVAFVTGGQPALEPERAETWSAGITLSPPGGQKGSFSASYFHIDFANRVQAPIQSLFSALTNPVYAQLVTTGPSAAVVSQVVGQTSKGVVNQTGTAFAPASVVAIIDDRFVNVSRETISGVDVAASYPLALGTIDRLDLSLNASYLTSDRRLLAQAPLVQLAGTVFNPARVRARAGAVWSHHAATLSAFVNRTGGVDDNRSSPTVTVGGQTALDMAIRLAPSGGRLSGWSFLLSAQNLNDDEPSRIRTSYVYATPYDSTNYSVIGRLISVTLTKRW